MSGHSKWSSIKHKKAATDAAKSKIFSKYAQLIALESKKAGGDTSAPGLVAVINRAKTENMPKDNIDRAVAKGISKDAGQLEQIIYEAYGPSGVAMVIDTLSDNRNRTAQEVKHLLSKNGVELATPGAASWAFTKRPEGVFVPNEPLTDLEGTDETKLQTILEALDDQEDVQAIYTNARGYENTSD